MTSTIHNADTFWPAFKRDLEAARGHVVIQSPFLSYPRLNQLAPYFRSLSKRGVAVCALIQKPLVHKYQREEERDCDLDEYCQPNTFNDLCAMLQSWDVHVTQLNEIHAKHAVIDREILWEGSLNMFSHTKAKEHMRRWNDTEQLEAVVSMQSLDSCVQCSINRKQFSAGRFSKQPSKQLGQVLANTRTTLNISQRQLARATGMSHQRISEIELGANVTVDTLFGVVGKLKAEVVVVPEQYVSAVCDFIQNGNSHKTVEGTF
jgi:DNA-binding transcriptional regulator YiaG